MTTQDTHTPGPWTWSREKIGDTWHAFLRGQPNHWNDRLVTAMREDLAAFPYAVDTPNARLIAAAPEMLAYIHAVMAALSEDRGNIDWPEYTRRARALLAKIEGR